MKKYINRIAERLSKIGFTIRETMTGTHQFTPKYAAEHNLLSTTKRKMEYIIDWGPDDILKWLNPQSFGFMKHPLQGEMTIAGLCMDAPCTGNMEIGYFTDQKIQYNIRFKARGEEFLYRGQKTNINFLKPWELHHTHTICLGRLIGLSDYGIVSTSTTKFDIRTLPEMLGSLVLEDLREY